MSGPHIPTSVVDPAEGVRTLVLSCYDFGKFIYALNVSSRSYPSPVHWAREVGCICFYACKEPSRKRKKAMNVTEMIEKWHRVFVGLAIAHDKDEADRHEARIDELLTPMLAAPVKQIRQFAEGLLKTMMADKSVPFLVWRAFEVYVEQMRRAPDEDVKLLKTELAKEIVDMVEDDAKRDLPAAMILALQWRSPEKLAQVKAVVETEKAAGRPVRLKGRESCLFLEAGGSENQPLVCVQV